MRFGSEDLLRRFSVGMLGAAVASVSFFGTLQLSAAPPKSMPEPAIDRTFKGDRLPAVPGVGARPVAPAAEPALPEGCVARADALRTIFATEVPGRCIAAAPERVLMG